MKKPESVTIGGIEHAIKYKEKVELNGTLCFGIYDDLEENIEILKEIKGQRLKATLFHEALHGVSEFYGYDWDESAIRWVGNTLLEFLQKNKEFTRFIVS